MLGWASSALNILILAVLLERTSCSVVACVVLLGLVSAATPYVDDQATVVLLGLVSAATLSVGDLAAVVSLGLVSAATQL